MSQSAVLHELTLPGGAVWTHLDARHPDCAPWLEAFEPIDALTREAMLAEETRPRLTELDQAALIILRGVNLNADAAPEDMVSIRIWVSADRIVSVRLRPLKAVMDIRDRIEAGAGPDTPGAFIVALAGRLFERMEPVLSELDDRLDGIETQVIDHPDPAERAEIVSLRKQAIVFRRYIAPQRDAIAQLRAWEAPLLSAHDRRRLQESLDRLTRYIEDLDAVRERAQIVKDELANALADRLNRNMYLLSVIAAIFLPLGFLTGMMGINIGGMPGVDSSSAFWIFAGLLAVIVTVQFIWFKRMKWF